MGSHLYHPRDGGTRARRTAPLARRGAVGRHDQPHPRRRAEGDRRGRAAAPDRGGRRAARGRRTDDRVPALSAPRGPRPGARHARDAALPEGGRGGQPPGRRSGRLPGGGVRRRGGVHAQPPDAAAGPRGRAGLGHRRGRGRRCALAGHGQRLHRPLHPRRPPRPPVAPRSLDRRRLGAAVHHLRRRAPDRPRLRQRPRAPPVRAGGARADGDEMTALTRRDVLRLASAAGAGALLGGPLARTAFAATTQDYDDGNSDVPGGLSGEPERVIVVGAGWAGLTVANALRNAGVAHVVLDGRDRIGGRARTASVGRWPIDLGCSWIHGPIGNPMTKFAEQAGVARTDGNVEEDAMIFPFYDGFLARELSPVGTFEALGHPCRLPAVASASLAAAVVPRASVRDGAQVYMDRQGLQGPARRHTEFVIRLLSEFVYGTDWAQMSLQYWSYANSESKYLGTGEGEFPEGGYTRLYTAMAGPQRVRLGHRVTAIEQRRNGVVVRAV